MIEVLTREEPLTTADLARVHGWRVDWLDEKAKIEPSAGLGIARTIHSLGSSLPRIAIVQLGR